MLVTSKKNLALYSQDKYFADVYAVEDLRERAPAGPFDFVLCDSFSPRVLKVKSMIAPTVQYAGLYGYLNGFEVHRTYFAFARMMELLSLSHIDEPIRPTISVPEKCCKSIPTDVCVAVGGEWAFRAYNHWLPVIQWLVDRGLAVILVGSNNGKETAEIISNSCPPVQSTVGQLSLPEVVKQIAACKVFIGADGGLWHIACAIPLPTVVLFADCQIFDEEGNRVTRETRDIVCETVYDDVAVSRISPQAVTEACERLFSRIGI